MWSMPMWWMCWSCIGIQIGDNLSDVFAVCVCLVRGKQMHSCHRDHWSQQMQCTEWRGITIPHTCRFFYIIQVTYIQASLRVQFYSFCTSPRAIFASSYVYGFYTKLQMKFMLCAMYCNCNLFTFHKLNVEYRTSKVQYRITNIIQLIQIK
jgi:hypothetical protein